MSSHEEVARTYEAYKQLELAVDKARKTLRQKKRGVDTQKACGFYLDRINDGRGNLGKVRQNLSKRDGQTFKTMAKQFGVIGKRCDEVYTMALACDQEVARAYGSNKDIEAKKKGVAAAV